MKSTEEIRRKAAELQKPLADFFHEQFDSGLEDVTEHLKIIDAACQVMMVTASNRLHEIKRDGTSQAAPFVLGGKFARLRQALEEWFRGHLTAEFGDEVDQLRVAGYLCENTMRMCARELTALKLQEEAERPRIIVAH